MNTSDPELKHGVAHHNTEAELLAEEGCLANLDELLASINPSNLHEETDWGPAVGKEVW